WHRHQSHREPVGSYRRLLYVSQKAVYQCTTYIRHTAESILNSSNSRYITDEALEEIREMFPSIEMDQDFYRNIENQRACYDAYMEENKIEQVNGFNDRNEETPTYERYNGSYAQDEMGYSDDDIDTIFDGDPLAYWNID
ncbi:hypothetical protein MR532_06320, partial [bacterium]|nr:hypothetical protein [bacterium]